jgi:hypothetical protein
MLTSKATAAMISYRYRPQMKASIIKAMTVMTSHWSVRMQLFLTTEGAKRQRHDPRRTAILIG